MNDERIQALVEELNGGAFCTTKVYYELLNKKFGIEILATTSDVDGIVKYYEEIVSIGDVDPHLTLPYVVGQRAEIEPCTHNGYLAVLIEELGWARLFLGLLIDAAKVGLHFVYCNVGRFVDHETGAPCSDIQFFDSFDLSRRKNYRCDGPSFRQFETLLYTRLGSAFLGKKVCDMLRCGIIVNANDDSNSYRLKFNSRHLAPEFKEQYKIVLDCFDQYWHSNTDVVLPVNEKQFLMMKDDIERLLAAIHESLENDALQTDFEMEQHEANTPSGNQ